VVERYESYLMQREKRQVSADTEAEALRAVPAVGGKRGRIRKVRVLDAAGDPTESIEPGMGLGVGLTVESVDPATRYHVGVAIDCQDGRCLFAAATHWDGVEPLSGGTHHTVFLRIPALPVAAGSFSVSAFLLDDTGLHTYDQVALATPLRVTSERWTGSLLVVPHQWKVVE
jgi:hypothetical protein